MKIPITPRQHPRTKQPQLPTMHILLFIFAQKTGKNPIRQRRVAVGRVRRVGEVGGVLCLLPPTRPMVVDRDTPTSYVRPGDVIQVCG